MYETQLTCWSWSDPHTTMLPTTTGRGRLNFSVYFCFLHHFCPCLLATSRFFSIEQLHKNNQNSAQGLNYPSRPTTPPCQQQQAAACIVWLWDFMSFAIFYKCFRAMSNFFQFIIYGHTMGKAETQPADRVLPPVLQHCLANINGQGWVYFCGEFF